MKPIALAGLALSLPFLAQAPATLQNPGFREGVPGEAPKGWILTKPSAEAGFHAEIAEDASLPGGRCVIIHREAGRTSAANLKQVVDAAAYRGKRIRVCTRLRLDPREEAGLGQAWVTVDRPGGAKGFVDAMEDRPVSVATWTAGTIVGDVAPDAETLSLGVIFRAARGRLRVAPFSLEILGDAPRSPMESPRALSERGLGNLAAFTKALGCIRFFHPSDAAARANWDQLAAKGVRAVEGAASAPDLARRLQAFFGPLAPSARFLAPGAAQERISTPRRATQVVRWVHVGFGHGDGGPIYASKREYLPLAQWKGMGWADPGLGRILDLGSGVRLMLPTVCYADGRKATLGGAIRATAPMPEPTGAAGDANDRATRLGDVALAWGVFRHFYPYFDLAGGSWEAELPRALAAAALDPDPEAFTHTLRRLTAPLKDGHIRVSGPGKPWACPGLALEMIDGWAVVKGVGESAKAVPAGSRILSVDGEPAGRRVQRLAEEISSPSGGWMDARICRELLAGPRDTPARIGFLTAGDVAGEATLPRDADPGSPPAGFRPPKVGEVRPGIWYVDLDRASEEDFQAALPSLSAAKGVLFDLRGYPEVSHSFLQHLTGKPITSTRWNIPVVTQPDGRDGAWVTQEGWDLQPLAPRIAGKVAFLTGGGAISKAESYLGIVEAYRLGEIVGSPSAGTNGNVNTFALPGGFHVRFTGMKVLKHDGTRLHGVGILPTVPARPTIAGLAAGRDEVLEKGLAVLEP